MKNYLNYSAALIFALTSCNDDNNNQSNSVPVITINGGSEMNVSLQGSYSEQGASANDIEDGDISSNIVVSGTVNTGQVDTYQIFYNVTDSDGNHAAQATRFVHVKNDADYLVGNYDVVSHHLVSSGSGTYYRVDELRSSETVNNKLDIISTNQGRFLKVNGNVLSMYYNYDSIGYGVLTNPTSFTLNYNIGGIYNYSDDYTKQ